MIKVDVSSRPQGVHVRVDDDEDERHDQVEDEPDVHHLDVGGDR
jgi:hypothetical protein